MTKQNRALKVIDSNSLPKIIDILEVPKSKESKPSNEIENLGNSGQNHAGNLATRARRRRRKPLELSKTPKISNLGWNKNITTRRARAKNTRPPKPKPISSSTKKKKGLGSSLLTPYGVHMARLKNQRTAYTALTSPLRKSPNVMRHYDRLKPISTNLYKQYDEQHHEEERSNNILGKKGGSDVDKNTTIDWPPSMKRPLNAATRKTPTTPSKDLTLQHKTYAERRTNEKGKTPGDQNEKENENENQNNSDDMDCDSSEGLSLNSSSSSSLSIQPEKTKPFANKGPSDQEESTSICRACDGIASSIDGELQFVDKIVHPESTRKVPSGFNNAKGGNLQIPLSATNKARTKKDIQTTEDSGNKPSSDSECTDDTENTKSSFQTNDKSDLVDVELLGFTIGDGQFIKNDIDDDSILTTSSVGDQKTGAVQSLKNRNQVSLRTPFISSHNPKSSQRLSRGSKCEGEESIEAWSITGHSGSPFFFEIGGKKYGHPALPPGWTMRISRGGNRPVYSHPDHGRTWHCPIKLTPNMVYVKTSTGKYLKQTKGSTSIESSKETVLTQRSEFHGGHTPQTPPSTIGPISQQKRSCNKWNSSLDQDDEDSTSNFMRDISRLAEGLRETSSKNLRKAERVKTIHQANTSSPNFSPSETSKVPNQKFISPKDLKEREERLSSQDYEIGTPSNMSDLLRQYEETNGGFNGVTVWNKKTTIGYAGHTTNLSSLPGLSLQSHQLQTSSKIRYNRHGQYNTLHNEITTDKVGSNQLTQRSSSEKRPSKFSPSLFDEGSMLSSENMIENQTREAVSFRLNSSTKSVDEDEKSKSKEIERIEAWFTPTLDIQENQDCATGCGSAVRFGAKKKERGRSRLYSTDEFANNDFETNTERIDKGVPTLKGSKTLLNDEPTIYDDEWSPLAKPRSVGNRIQPRQQESIEKQEEKHRSPDSPNRDGCQPIDQANPNKIIVNDKRTKANRPMILYDDEWSPLAKPGFDRHECHSSRRERPGKEYTKYERLPDRKSGDRFKTVGVPQNHRGLTATADPNNRGVDSNKINDVPGQSHYNDHSDASDSNVQSKVTIADQRFLHKKRMNNTELAAKTTKNISKLEQEEDPIGAQSSGNENSFDRASDSDTFENVLNKSSDSLSTTSNSRFGGVRTKVQTWETESVTVTVHAHAAKTISRSTLDVIDKEPFENTDQTSRTTEADSSLMCDRSNGTHTTTTPDVSTGQKSTKPNDEIVQVEAASEDKPPLSGESIHSSKMASPHTSHNDNMTNDNPLHMDAENESQPQSGDEQSISKLSTNQESGAELAMVFTNQKSISGNAESSDNNCIHEFSIADGGANSCGGSFTFTDDPHDNFDESPGQTNSGFGDNDATTCSGDETSSPNEYVGLCVEGTSALSVQTATFEKFNSFESPQSKDSDISVHSPLFRNPTCTPRNKRISQTKRKQRGFKSMHYSLRKKSRLRWRVLNPPHPICSLQRLDELKIQRDLKRRRAKLPKRGKRTKTTKKTQARHRKGKLGASS